MSWKLYAFTSGGAVIFAAAAALVAPTPRTQSAPVATPQAVDSSGAVVDLGAQAERLRSKLAEVSTYRQPARDAFRFGAAPRRVVESVSPAVTEAPPVVITPPRPPYALAGMAISVILLAVAILLALVVIILIDNTIRLAMISNRFLIKTMQMVGATRWFIAKPMNMRAILNGAISGIIAIAAVILVIFGAERVLPEMKAIHDNTTLALLFSGLIVLGICITLFSTHRSVLKYLRMKLDDLY